jgi:hypothetical protein
MFQVTGILSVLLVRASRSCAVAGGLAGNFCPCEYQPPVLGLRNSVQSGSTPTLHAYVTSMHWQLFAVSFSSDNTIAYICVVIALGALQNTL